MVGPMARPGARGLGPGLKCEIVLRAGPGPHNSICGPGPGQVCTTAAGRAGPGPRFQARAGPYCV